MGWFSRKKKNPAAGNAALTPAVNEQGTAAPSPSPPAAMPTEEEEEAVARRKADKARRRQEKHEAKCQARAARREKREMQRELKRVRKVLAKYEKQDKKRTRAAQRMQRAQVRAQRRADRKRDKEAVRRRKNLARAEKTRRKEAAKAAKAAAAAAAAAALDTPPPVPVPTADPVAATAVPTSVAPKFQERKRCVTCHRQFQRVPSRFRHHCRNCGESFCSKCLSSVKRPIPWFNLEKPQKVCFGCDTTVFNGMGGAIREPTAASTSPVAPATAAHAEDQRTSTSEVERERQPSHRQSLSRSQSQPVSESTEGESPRSRLQQAVIKLRPRSRRDNTSSASSRRSSRWTLPIRPLLRRKESAEQSKWNLDVHLEKAEELARRRRSQMVLLEPQVVVAA